MKNHSKISLAVKSVLVAAVTLCITAGSIMQNSNAEDRSIDANETSTETTTEPDITIETATRYIKPTYSQNIMQIACTTVPDPVTTKVTTTEAETTEVTTEPVTTTEVTTEPVTTTEVTTEPETEPEVNVDPYTGYELSYSDPYYVCDNPLNSFNGVLDFNGHHETFYDEKVLPGGALDIPGRHVASDGTVRDGDGYICVASDLSYLSRYSVLLTSLGPAKVYDTGCAYGTIDVYVNW